MYASKLQWLQQNISKIVENDSKEINNCKGMSEYVVYSFRDRKEVSGQFYAEIGNAGLRMVGTRVQLYRKNFCYPDCKVIFQ